MNDAGSPRTIAIAGADAIACDATREAVWRNDARARQLRRCPIDHATGPATVFSPFIGHQDRQSTITLTEATSSEPPERPSRLQDVVGWPLADLAALVRTRQVTATELTQLYLGRLLDANPVLNCAVTVTAERALAQAARADEDLAAGRYKGPLHGIPWGCKDLLTVRGYPTTWGSAAYRKRVLDDEATVVQRLDEAGAILIAKLSTGELGAGDRWFGGWTRNPRNLGYSSSGSSGGSATAVAAGLVGFAIGTDTSGSLLTPAAVCGVTGFRPTFGSVSRHGVRMLAWSVDRVGPIGRSPRDCAIVHDVIAGTDPNDPTTTDSLMRQASRDIDVKRLRVAYLATAFEHRRRGADAKRNDQRSLSAITALGIELAPVALAHLPWAAFYTIINAEAATWFERMAADADHRAIESRAAAARAGRLISAVDYLNAQRIRATVVRQWTQALEPYDVYVAPYPAVKGTPLDVATGRAVSESSPVRPSRADPAVRHAFCSAVTGFPALTVPNGVTADGLVTSIMFSAPPGKDAVALALADAYYVRS
jgi:Asp-tRNA(Asn)/Glu-tRNA(Gln) amidotransferase A subunit family amidase